MSKDNKPSEKNSQTKEVLRGVVRQQNKIIRDLEKRVEVLEKRLEKLGRGDLVIPKSQQKQKPKSEVEKKEEKRKATIQKYKEMFAKVDKGE